MDVQIINPDHAKIIDALVAFQERPATEVLEDLIEMSQIYLAMMANPLGKALTLEDLREQATGDPGMASYVRFFLDIWNAGERKGDTDGS